MIIDSHTHIFSPEIAGRREYYCSRDACFSSLYSEPKALLSQAEDLILSMDEKGISRSVVHNIGWIDQELCERNNDYIIESVLRYPDRLIGFCSIQPLAQERAARELEKCFDAGMWGVGELRPDVQGFDLTNKELLSPLIDIISRNNACLSIHASEPVGHVYNGKGETGPGILYSFIQQHPGLNVILAHFGGGLPFYQLMPEVNTALKNTYYDTAAAPFLYSPGIYHVINKICGNRKLLFGSDWPLLDQSRVLKHIESGGLNVEDRANIMFNNASRLFNLDIQGR